MPDLRYSPSPFFHETYRIMRKGSRYNILGPQGRIFTKYKSASIAGPRWEELTQTPWPYPSSAYEPGTRLWQLGIIRREEVGQRTRPAPPQPARASRPIKPAPPLPVPPTILALPAPRIDLQKQICLMRDLRRDPVLLFDPAVRQALQHEVDYHRPDARWAQHLLHLLARYEQRSHRIPARV